MAARPQLHVVALAHLDTQWRWTVRDTVRDHLPATVRENERLFDSFPRYVLSFEGAHRYRLLAEHHPELFERLRQRVREGRWAPVGAALEAFDTLLPSPESILRQIVYGRRWFRAELGVESRDLFLPDCFGFPSTLPTLAVHAGIVGFSTQKLRRGELMRSAVGIPFAYGIWRGTDGSELLAALDPGEYSGRIEGDLTRDPAWRSRFAALAAAGIPERLLLYVGTGDRGGAPPATTIAGLEEALAGDGEIEVHHGASEAIYLATSADERARLPRYEGELLLRLHGTGCYTAKAILKRWNRIGELLALRAEAAAALASWLGQPAPLARLERAWSSLLVHQMHDDLTGTSIPAAYRFSLDDLGLAANELQETTLDAVHCAAGALDLSGGDPTLLLLSVNAAPADEIVELTLAPGASRPTHALSPEGEPAPIQLAVDGDRCSSPNTTGGTVVLVPAHFEGVELQVVRLVSQGFPAIASFHGHLEAADDRLESDRYRACFDSNGRLATLFDKQLERELLAGPLQHELLPDRSSKYPAWEIRWEDSSSRPLAEVERLVSREPIESGPLRASLRIARAARGVELVETWSLLAGGAGDRLDCTVRLDWRRRGALLKLRFPLAAAADRAHFDTGLGAITRPIASASLYEVPAQRWAAIDDPAAGFGVALFSDCRHGWDFPERSTLRLTLVHAPNARGKFGHQATHDFGRHRFRLAIAGLSVGAVADGSLAVRADRFAQPVSAYRIDRPAENRCLAGSSWRRILFLSTDSQIRLLALKPAERGEGIVVRVANPTPEAIEARLDLQSAPTALFAVDALETELDSVEDAPVADSTRVRARIPGHAVRSLEIRLAPPATGSPPAAATTALTLPWTVQGFSMNRQRARSSFDGRGALFPNETLPRRIDQGPVPFDLSHLGRPGGDTLVPAGQVLELAADMAELWLLAASVEGDRAVNFEVDGRLQSIVFPDWRRSFLAESRWSRRFGLPHFDPGEFRRCPTAWSSGHLHDRRGRDLPVERGSLFALRLALGGVLRLELPHAPAVRIVAATLSARSARSIEEAMLPLFP